ncbi:MAG: fibrobacter succinogenes major paralogous domain-containing protein [Dysgonamonadaceae bacterium]|jgi:hypothetical protein|nr:fibrobacter succinogenes major paralogous domain-containing protein [Dysgonamonadaceae bacterium]
MTTPSVSFVFAAVLSAVVFSFSSCSEDEGGVSVSGKASLRINVAGISAGGEESLTRAALEPETVVLTADDGTPVEFTLSVDPASVTRSTTLMATNTKYRVIVYKASDNSFVTEAAFTAGTAGSITGLEQDTPYKLVAISYNTTTAPPSVGSGNTTITVDPSNDLLHWVGSVTIASGSVSPTVEITFKHRFPKLTVSIDTSLTGENITGLTSATLTPGYQGVQTLLTDGTPNEGASILTQTFTTWTAFNATSVSSQSRYVFTGNDSPLTVAFSGLILHGTSFNPTTKFSKSGGLVSGHSYTLTARVEASKGNYYPIVGGSAYEVTIPLSSSNAYSYTDKDGNTATVGTLTFLRYNLGADPSMTPKQQMAYPHTDSKNIRVYGGLFQWGRKDVYHALRDAKADVPDFFTSTQYSIASGTNHYDPSTSHKFVWGNTFSPLYWCSDDVMLSNLWGNGHNSTNQTDFRLSQATKTPITAIANSYNPCPDGYRVPTQYEWALILYENGNIASVDDKFESNGLNTSRNGTTWYITSSNLNVVWVRVSNGKPSTVWSSLYNTMNGYAVYSFSALGSPSSDDILNATFAIDKNLADINAPDPLMFLPAAGFRRGTDGIVSYVNQGGFYWSTTNSNLGSLDLRIYDTGIYVHGDNGRLRGYSVRCIKEFF